jgi:hypothetical protein
MKGKVPDGMKFVRVVGITVLTTLASEGASLHQIGSWPGYPRGATLNLELHDHFAYLANWEGAVAKVDISDPAHPTLVASFPGEIVFDLVVRAGRVYALGGDHFYILDANSLQLLGALYPPFTGGFGLDVAGNYAYVATQNGLKVLNVSDPTAITVMGTHTNRGSARAVHVQGQYAYVTTLYMSGLEIFDVSDPSALQRLGTFDSELALNVRVVDGRAYLADMYTGLHILDVSNPRQPLLLGSHRIGDGGAHDVHLVGSRAYVASGNYGFAIVDVTNPASPALLGGLWTSGTANGIVVRDGYAFIASTYEGLNIVSVDNPAAPSLLSELDLSGSVEDVAIAGDFAYVADRDDGLRVLDISRPAQPVAIATFDEGWAFLVRVASDRAYVIQGSLNVLSITNPHQPVLLGRHFGIGFTRDIELKGHHIFLAGDGIKIIDVTYPTSLVQAGVFSPDATYSDIEIAGDLALAVGTTNVQILSLSNTVAPVLLGTYSPDYYFPAAAAVDGTVAYIASAKGLHIVSIAEPDKPRPLAVLQSIYNWERVAVAGGIAFVSDSWGRFFLVDVRNPGNPRLLETHDFITRMGPARLTGRHLFLPDSNSGLHVFDQPYLLWITARTADSGIQLVVDGLSGRQATLECTEQLSSASSWTPVMTNNLPFLYNQPTHSGNRFYRAVGD